MRERLERRGDSLLVDMGSASRRIPVSKLFIAGSGKASLAMATALHEVVPEAPGLVIAPQGTPSRRLGRIRIRRGSHPLPGPKSQRATQELLDVLRATSSDSTVLFLLSGGSSALLAMPRHGLTMEDKARFSAAMLRGGAPIELFNRARMRLSAVKGGGLLHAVAPRRVLTLALSDVASDDPGVIGSGPTVAARADRGEDLGPVVEPFAGQPAISPRVARLLARPLPVLHGRARAEAVVIAGNGRARQGAALAARRLGYRVRRPRWRLQGEASQAAQRVTAALRAAPREVSCLIWGGETTVSVGEQPGRGGRSQEFALAAAAVLAETDWVVLAGGTDGIDGPTDVAGGIVDPDSLGKIGGQWAIECLHRHDSHKALAAGGYLLHLGPTGTNVGDLVIALRNPY